MREAILVAVISAGGAGDPFRCGHWLMLGDDERDEAEERGWLSYRERKTRDGPGKGNGICFSFFLFFF
ncbi:hypothetical protein MA16_Dca019442 [Dendrobium catenatum]|uniref:Uncharacterized protein n=1 Tax=Dendrobium catenatum TaxID=906689 RepID=A0A2I0WRU5_9ASPA|nr:hypothetical protein MA16_Dca019442 [Dendrobium catenatum]